MICHVSAECAPLVKVGGMADVVYGLCKHQLQSGASPFIILPYYSFLQIPSRKFTVTSLDKEPVEIHLANLEGIPLYLIKSSLLYRSRVYGESDDLERFIHFSRAAAWLIEYLKAPFVHLHDWHTALISSLILPRPSLFTIHNLSYQGIGHSNTLSALGISTPSFEWHNGMINLLKGGLENSKILSTVSPQYAQEIQSAPLGCGLESLLKHRAADLYGILNGIDMDMWNPETDPHIPFHFHSRTASKGKEANRKALFEMQGINSSAAPLVATITRFDWQKGPEFILEGIEKSLNLGAYFFLLATPSNPEMRDLLDRFPLKHQNLRIIDRFDERLAHLVYASADYLFIPSRFEPCGLTQLIAMRYGALPIAHRTGGLADTIVDRQTGYLFDSLSTEAISSQLERALKDWDTPFFYEMRDLVMKQDFGWKNSAKIYGDLYSKLLEDSCKPK